MRTRRNKIRRIARVAGQGAIGPIPPDAAHTILTIDDDANADGVAQVTTAAAHGLIDNQDVTISGNSNAAYNGAWKAGVAAGDNPLTQFWILNAGLNPIAFAGLGIDGHWS